ncbi:N2227-domain-containing protein [Pluteus cervinus]|uniref:N2227-domain-containing protein n=1 Tax=Pluteus cervinus TaxID=181527 RepID=A0ACD3BC47_9AGAR|nr:N2227-domain-containing protein [Pluteus cervinus]
MLRSYVRLIPALAITGAIVYSILQLEGPFTIQLVIPSGINVSYPQPQIQYVPQQQVVPEYQAPLQRKLPSYPPHQKPILDAIAAFNGYEETARRFIAKKDSKYAKANPRQQAMMRDIGYEAHFDRAQKEITVNAQLVRDIVAYGQDLYGVRAGDEDGLDENYGIVDEALGHLVRDWSDFGVTERSQIFPPILKALQEHLGHDGKKKILLPGFGLGRLAHEVAEIKDYQVTANDLDYNGILSYHYVLNRTKELFDHQFYPFNLDWTQQLFTNTRFQGVKFPDYKPSPHSRANVKLMEGDFMEVFAPEEYIEKYDAVVSLFFIDVGENVVDFLEMIHRVLKPGGIWINLGPLKWGGFAHMQLSAEEVLQVADKIGFDVNHDSRQSIETQYARQPHSLIKFVYGMSFVILAFD